MRNVAVKTGTKNIPINIFLYIKFYQFWDWLSFLTTNFSQYIDNIWILEKPLIALLLKYP